MNAKRVIRTLRYAKMVIYSHETVGLWCDNVLFNIIGARHIMYWRQGKKPKRWKKKRRKKEKGNTTKITERDKGRNILSEKRAGNERGGR
jgi:hypothetical protein